MTKRLVIFYIDGIAAAFVFLYLYTGITKAIHHQEFLGSMLHIPLIAGHALLLSILIPLFEISISVLLFISRTRFIGLIGATLLMLSFTIYVIYIYTSPQPLPCTCGGIIQQMGWKVHLMFNTSFTIASVFATLLHIRYNDFIAISRSSRKPVEYSRQPIH